jgi:hypothetical protein
MSTASGSLFIPSKRTRIQMVRMNITGTSDEIDPDNPPWPSYDFVKFLMEQGKRLMARERHEAVEHWSSEAAVAASSGGGLSLSSSSSSSSSPVVVAAPDRSGGGALGAQDGAT